MTDQSNNQQKDTNDLSVKSPDGGKRILADAGKYIFREGETGDLAFVVLNGKVEISHVVDGKNVSIGIVGPGAMFGEMALIDNERRMASARAHDGKVEILVISREIFQKKLSTADPFVKALIDILTSHIRGLASKISKSEMGIS
jgi:CRP/FNR family cyclic AMP-dependent transcriptional regulator